MEGDCILPYDLVDDILSRLTVRDLLRCRCVSKAWRALIDRPYFIRKHYQVQYSISKVSGNNSYFVEEWSHKFYLLSIQQDDVNTSDLTDDLKRDCKDMLPPWVLHSSIGCVNGIICLIWGHLNNQNKFLGLWNPATREFKAVACPYIPLAYYQVAGFGFDNISEDLKILGVYTLLTEDKWSYNCYEIYSLKSNSWKSLRGPSADFGSGRNPDGYLNGVLYWHSELQQVNGKQLVIVSFNFSSENFKVSYPPEDACLFNQVCYPFEIRVTLYKESIALLISHEVQEKSALYTIGLWVVTHFDDCGVPLSWQHLLTVGPTLAELGLYLVSTLINGDLILSVFSRNKNCVGHSSCNCVPETEWCVYEMSSSEFKKFEIDLSNCGFRYVESLFPLLKRLALQN